MPTPNSSSQFDDLDLCREDSGKRCKRILVREVDAEEMDVDHDGTTIQEVETKRKDLSLRSLEETDVVEVDGTTIQEVERDLKNRDDLSLRSLDDTDVVVSMVAIGERDDTELEVERGGNAILQTDDYDDHLSLRSVSEGDFLSDEDRDRQQHPLQVPDRRLNHAMVDEAQVLRPPSLRKSRDRRYREKVVRRFYKRLFVLEQDLETTCNQIMATNEYFEEMSRVKSQGQGLMGASLRRYVCNVRGRRLEEIQSQKYEQVSNDFIALVDVVEKDSRDDFNLAGLENWKREVKRLHMACRACTERVQPPEVCPSPPQVQPPQEDKSSFQRFDLSETETTLVVPFVPSIEDGIESPPLTPPLDPVTMESPPLTPPLDGVTVESPPLTPPLDRVTVRVATPAWPETLPARSRLAPIQNLSAKAKKLLQGGLGELQQDMTQENKCGKGEKKKSAKREKKKTQSYVKPTPVLDFTDEQQDVKEEKKKKKNVGKRFLQWLSRKFLCGCCSDV